MPALSFPTVNSFYPATLIAKPPKPLAGHSLLLDTGSAGGLMADRPSPFTYVRFGAQQGRTVLTIAEREQRQKAERLAQAQWKQLPLLFQTHYPNPGHRISPDKMACLSDRILSLPHTSKAQILNSTVHSVFKAQPERTPLRQRERLFLEHIALIRNLFANDRFGEISKHGDKKLIAFFKGIQNNVFRDQLITLLAADAAWPVRAVAGKALGHVNNKKLQKSLIKKLLKDPAYWVKTQGAHAIILLDNDEQKLQLIRTYSKEPGYDFHEGLAKAIASLSDENLKTKLINDFSISTDDNERDLAACYIPYMPESPQTDALIDRLSRDPFLNVRYFVAENLAKVQDPALKDQIILRMANDRTINVQRGAAKVLKHITDEPLKLQTSLQFFNRRDSDYHMRYDAIQAIGSLSAGYDQTKAALFRTNQASQKRHVADLYSEIITTIHDEDLKATLVKEFYNHKSSQMTYRVSNALESIKDEKLRADTLKYVLLEEVKNPSKSTIFFYTYKSFKDEALKYQILELMLNSGSDKLRESIVPYASEHHKEKLEKDPKFQAWLIEHLKDDPNPVIRYAMHQLFPEIYTPEEQQQTALALLKLENKYKRAYGLKMIIKSRDIQLQARLLPRLFERAFAGKEIVNEYNALLNAFTSNVDDIVIPEIKEQVLAQTLLGGVKTESGKQDEHQIPEEKRALNNVAKSTQDIELKTSLLKTLVRDISYNIQNTSLEILTDDILPLINGFITDVPYTQLLKSSQVATQIGNASVGPGLIIPLQTLGVLGLDARALNQAVSDLQRFRQHAFKSVEKFSQANDSVMSTAEMGRYLDEKTPILLQGILVMGRGAMLDKFDQRKERFEGFLETLELVLRDDDITQRLFQVRQLPSIDGKEDAYQRTKLLELAYGFMTMGKKDKLLAVLDEMITKQTLDMNSICHSFIQNLGLYAGLAEDEAEKLSQEQLALWNLDQINTIPLATRQYTRDDNGKLKDFERLIQATLQRGYKDMIEDPTTALGQANEKTHKAFLNHRLDYDQWLDYQKTHRFELALGKKAAQKTHQMEIGMWARQPGYDLFQGNYSQACTAMGGHNGPAMVEALMHTFVQMAEVRDMTTGKTIGKIQLVWMNNMDSGEPVLLVDNIQLAGPYDKEPVIVEYIREFSTQLGEDIAGKPVKVVMGKNLNKVAPEAEKKLSDTRLKFQIIGATVSPKFFLSAYDGYQWPNIRRSRRLKFFQLHPPVEPKGNPFGHATKKLVNA